MHFFFFNFSALAEIPAVRDCSVLYGLGYTSPGVYLIDPTGAGDLSKAREVECHDGYTVLLARRQSGNEETVGQQHQ